MRKLLFVLLIVYLCALLYLTLVFHTGHRVSGNEAVNLAPFRTIGHYLREGGWEMRVNVVGNLLAFLPLGILLPLLRQDGTGLRHVIVAGVALSAAIELAQYVSGRRVADVDDVLLNAVGTVIGYALWSVCHEAGARLRLRDRKGA